MSEHEGLGEFMLNFGLVTANCRSSHPFIAEIGGRPIATGMMFVHDDVAVLAGASTIPDSRNQGAQNALLHARLAKAADLGLHPCHNRHRPRQPVTKKCAEKTDLISPTLAQNGIC